MKIVKMMILTVLVFMAVGCDGKPTHYQMAVHRIKVGQLDEMRVVLDEGLDSWVVYTNYVAPGNITQVIARSVEKPAIMVRGLSGQPLPVGSRVRFKRVSYSSNAVWPTESVLLVEPIDFSAAHNKK